MFSVVYSGNVPPFSFHRFTFPSSDSDDYPSIAPWFSFPWRNFSEIIIYSDGGTSGKGRRNTKKSVQFPDGWFEICLALNE